MSANERLLTEAQVAKRLNLSRRCLAGWRQLRKGPPFLDLGQGGRPVIRYRESDLELWLEQSRIETR